MPAEVGKWGIGHWGVARWGADVAGVYPTESAGQGTTWIGWRKKRKRGFTMLSKYLHLQEKLKKTSE